MDTLTVGNAAKLYCLNWIEAYVQQKTSTVTILDLGCGRAANFVALLQKYPHVRYVGVEPSTPACQQAESNVQGLNAKILNAYAYSIHAKLQEEFDLVVSFSVLEHVYRRPEYLRSAKECLKPEGYFLINYDAGHFVMNAPRDRIKRRIGPFLAHLGRERYYLGFVREQEFRGMIQAQGLSVIDEHFFNTSLKGVYKLIPEAQRAAYMEKWLSLELWLNSVGIPYDDGKAQYFVTRNFILRHQGLKANA